MIGACHTDQTRPESSSAGHRPSGSRFGTSHPRQPSSSPNAANEETSAFSGTTSTVTSTSCCELIPPVLPVSCATSSSCACAAEKLLRSSWTSPSAPRSEEHTSELQSRGHLVCRLLLEKKK